MNAQRREFLTAVSAAALSAIAGCADLLDGDTDDTDDSDAGNGEDEGNADEPDKTDETDEADASGTDLPADDWPSFQRTARNDGYAPASAPTDDPAERWSTTLSGALEEQVAVVDGPVYAATDDGTVHALEAASGDERWTESLEGGRSQCPCVVDGLVVVGTDAGELVALDASDGTREWTADLAGPVAAPTAAEGTVYVGTSEEPTAYAIDPANGDERWSSPLAVDAVDYPAVARHGVYVGAYATRDGRLYALARSDGSERWVYEAERMQPPMATDDGVTARGRTLSILTTASEPRQGATFSMSFPSAPAATATTLFGGSNRGTVMALDRAEGGPDWHESFPGPISSTAVTDDCVYLTTGDPELVALDVATGDHRWSRSLEAGLATGPTVADGAVFVGTNESRLVVFE